MTLRKISVHVNHPSMHMTLYETHSEFECYRITKSAVWQKPISTVQGSTRAQDGEKRWWRGWTKPLTICPAEI